MQSTTFAAEVDGRQLEITRFGTDWQHASGTGRYGPPIEPESSTCYPQPIHRRRSYDRSNFNDIRPAANRTSQMLCDC
ncbi:hypothetical protein EHI42_23875 [Rhizobium hidalgonense]|nr:hypothetical protein EHI42_23875 [Rhizobium hidalgonense]